MARRLARSVTLQHPEGGVPVVLKAGTVPPAWAEDEITNPKAWGEEISDDAPAPAGDGSGPGDDGSSGSDPAGGDAGGGSDDELPDPPEETATAAVWLAYANDVLELGLAKKAKKADIVAAVEARLDEIDAADA